MLNLTNMLNGSIERLIHGAEKSTVFGSSFSKMRLRLLKSAAKRKTMEIKGLHVPPFIIASITSKCNLNCAGCYAHANNTQRPLHTPLTTSQWRDILGQARDLGVSFVLLAGGEPLLRRDVVELAEEFPELVFPVFTNGTLADSSFFETLEKSRNIIPVLSIEGGKSVTDTRRGEGTFDRLKNLMDSLKSREIFFAVSITVTKNNLYQVTGVDFAKELEKSGCGLVFYVEYVPADGKSAGIAPGDKERAELKSQIAKLRSESEMLLISFPGDEDKMGGCLAAGRGFFHINADGSAEPCPFSPYSELNLRNCSLEQALKSEFFRKLRAEDIINANHDGGCVLWEKREKVKEIVKGVK